MKIPFLELANRITGISIFGISWEPPILDVQVAKALLTFLEDRRVLFNPLGFEVPDQVVRSVLEIRQRLTEDLEKLDRSSELAKSIRIMRGECRRLLDDVNVERMQRPVSPASVWHMLYTPLMDFRAVFGVQIAHIAVRYGIDVEEHLVSLFPPTEDSDRE